MERIPVQRTEDYHPHLSEMKSTVIKPREFPPPMRWAYENLLRTQSKTKKIYPVDPYVEVYTFRENLFGFYMESLDGMGNVWAFLINGPEKAMLIDDGYGLGDLKGLCDEITGGKELIVVNTHWHFDHAYGNCQFDRVYCDKYEEPIIRANMNPHIWDYLFSHDENGGNWSKFDPDDFIKFKEYELIGVEQGYTWNLGGDHEIEFFHLGGHTPGQGGFLDKKLRIFFPGDDCVFGEMHVLCMDPNQPNKEQSTIAAMRQGIAKVIQRRDEFDWLFPSHGPVDLHPVVLNYIVEACDRILDDPLHPSYGVHRFTTLSPDGPECYYEHIYQYGVLGYMQNSVGDISNL